MEKGESFIARGVFKAHKGNVEEPRALVLILHDSEGKFFEKEEIELVGKKFISHLMKACGCSLAPHLRNHGIEIKVTKMT